MNNVIPPRTNVRGDGMPVRCVIYCRISRDNEGDGWGVGDQEKRCRQLAQQMRWEVVTVITDNDLSASRHARKQRPGWERLKIILELGQADAIVTQEVSRLTRRPKEFFELQEANPKLKIKTADEFIDLAKGIGSFMAGIKAIVDAEESERMAKRIRRRKESDALNGRPHPGGHRVFGYEGAKRNADGIIVNKGKLNTVVIEREAALIREAAQRILTGDGLKTVADDWNRRGLPTVTGTRWSDVVIRQVLTRPHVAGYRNHPRVGMVRGAWEPIIDKPTFDKLQRALRPKQQRVSGYRYLLTGLLYCWKCDGALTGKFAKGAHRYKCEASRDGLRRCYAVSRLAQPLEGYVVEEVLKYLEKHPPLVHEHHTNDELEGQLVEALDTYKADLEQLTLDYYEHHLISRELFVRTAETFNERIATIEEKLGELSTSRAFLAVSDDDIRGTWERITSFEWQRNLLRSAVERIDVQRVGKGCHSFDSAAIAITWRA
jgi:site-specific DNA recombinase